MYWDLIVLLLLVVAVVLFFKRFSSSVYLIAIIDIFLRLLTFVSNNLGVPELSSLIDKYFPTSMMGIINRYSNGIINTVLMWCLFVIYCIFLFYITRTFWKRK